MKSIVSRKSHLISPTPPGPTGERFVARLLAQQLYYIWDRNWTIQEGEIDIIAQRQHTLHFVEVKTRHARTGLDFAAERAVDLTKTERLRFLADRYEYHNQKKLLRYRITAIQFDIVAVEYLRIGPFYRCSATYYPDAFSA